LIRTLLLEMSSALQWAPTPTASPALSWLWFRQSSALPATWQEQQLQMLEGLLLLLAWLLVAWLSCC
jgi:hypothetical protein